jgi:hypothetical protein
VGQRPRPKPRLKRWRASARPSPMSAHLSWLRLFQRHLRSLVWVWVWVWDWIHSHTSLRTRSPSSCHLPITHYPFPPRSLVRGGQTSPHKSRLVVSHRRPLELSSVRSGRDGGHCRSSLRYSYNAGSAGVVNGTWDPLRRASGVWVFC